MLLSFLIGGDAVPATHGDGVFGTFSHGLFNGLLRLRAMSLKEALPADNVWLNATGERALVFHAIVSNGAHHESRGFFDATLADADGIAIEGRPLDDGWDLERGAAARIAIGFYLPADFVPLKLLLIEAAPSNSEAFRVTIRPSDLPGASKARILS